MLFINLHTCILEYDAKKLTKMIWWIIFDNLRYFHSVVNNVFLMSQMLLTLYRAISVTFYKTKRSKIPWDIHILIITINDRTLIETY